jgi:hypothetical protein
MFFLALVFSSAAFAKPVLYVCERPAWDGKEGCGPDNTYYTYNLFLDTDDFDKDLPVYDFQMKKGCDASEATMWTYQYKAYDDNLEFWFNRVPHGKNSSQLISTIKLDLKTMKAHLSKVENSTELTCREEKAPNRRPGTSPARRGY